MKIRLGASGTFAASLLFFAALSQPVCAQRESPVDENPPTSDKEEARREAEHRAEVEAMGSKSSNAPGQQGAAPASNGDNNMGTSIH